MSRRKPQSEADFQARRELMVQQQIANRGVRDRRVLDVLRTVPRHLFVDEDLRAQAYEDHPLPIGQGQTISQPYIVALMTELLDVRPSDKVLEIGTGSGYQAAVLAELCEEVYSVEIKEELAQRASERLKALHYDNVHVICTDGYRGWPEHAPYDKILVTAAPPQVPPKLLEQLIVGGRLVAPVGGFFQELVVLDKTAKGVEERTSIPVRFVPMVGNKED